MAESQTKNCSRQQNPTPTKKEKRKRKHEDFQYLEQVKWISYETRRRNNDIIKISTANITNTFYSVVLVIINILIMTSSILEATINTRNCDGSYWTWEKCQPWMPNIFLMVNNITINITVHPLLHGNV